MINYYLILGLIILPWFLFDLYFLLKSLALIALKNKPLLKACYYSDSLVNKQDGVILIPIFNNSATVLNNLLPSIKNIILHDDKLPIDTILIDSSTDGTEELVLKYLEIEWNQVTDEKKIAHKKNLTFLHLNKREGGKAWAINKIAFNLQYKYFCLLDSDWHLSFDSFCKGINFLEHHKEYSYAQLAWVAESRKLNMIEGIDQVSIEYRHQLENRVRLWVHVPATIHGSAVVIRADLFKKFNGFDELVLSEDVDLAIRFMLGGYFGIGLYDITMKENPCDHFKQFFWQKARWAEGRSQLLSKYSGNIINSKTFNLKQKVFWIYYLAYFGRCVTFSLLVAGFIFGVLIGNHHLLSASLFWIIAIFVLRNMSHFVTALHRTNKIPLYCRFIEPFSFYGIGLIYTYTFFSGLFQKRGKWRIIERNNK